MSESYTTEELRQEAQRLIDRRSSWTWEKLALFAVGNADRAERERDSARADALEEAAKVFDAIPDETELSPEHWQTDPDSGARVKFGKTTKRAALRPSSVAARIRALKPVQGEQ